MRRFLRPLKLIQFAVVLLPLDSYEFTVKLTVESFITRLFRLWNE